MYGFNRFTFDCRREGCSREGSRVVILITDAFQDESFDEVNLHSVTSCLEHNLITYYNEMARYRHLDSVELMGSHDSATETALICEYLPGGSLYYHLDEVCVYYIIIVTRLTIITWLGTKLHALYNALCRITRCAHLGEPFRNPERHLSGTCLPLCRQSSFDSPRHSH